MYPRNLSYCSLQYRPPAWTNAWVKPQMSAAPPSEPPKRGSPPGATNACGSLTLGQIPCPIKEADICSTPVMKGLCMGRPQPTAAYQHT